MQFGSLRALILKPKMGKHHVKAELEPTVRARWQELSKGTAVHVETFGSAVGPRQDLR